MKHALAPKAAAAAAAAGGPMVVVVVVGLVEEADAVDIKSPVYCQL